MIRDLRRSRRGEPRDLDDAVIDAVAVGRGHVAVTERDLTLGTLLLRLVADWNTWIERRVDSFAFAGDDERALRRHQSVDLVVPDELQRLQRRIGRDPSVIPVPLTFVEKGRVAQFSLRDEADRAVPLIARRASTALAAGMLLALANVVMTGRPASSGAPVMARQTVETLVRIAASESGESLNLCAGLVDAPNNCARTLAGDATFMSLAYELARAFPLIAVLPVTSERRRVLKFAYTSPVVRARPDFRRVRLRHFGRTLRNRSRDLTESARWGRRHDPADPAAGELVLSTQAKYAVGWLREREESAGVACVLATIRGPRRCSRTIRLRPNSAVRLHGLPPGRYSVKLRAVSGFDLDGPDERPFSIDRARSRLLHVAATRKDVAQRVTKAVPRIAARAWPGLMLSRALAWNNKPLAIRVRLGHGGSYHCEFEAPAGMHVTRARLVSDVAVEESGRRSRQTDVVLESGRRVHLYAPAELTVPATGYAFIHLRPRLETVLRSALIGAAIASAALVFVALTWNVEGGYTSNGPTDASALLVVILAAPSALSAYLVQGISSRVTASLLSGVRSISQVPSLLTLIAAAVLLVGEHRTCSHLVLWSLVSIGGLTIAGLLISAWSAEHPREQAQWNQGPGFAREFSVTRSSTPAAPARADPGADKRVCDKDPGRIRSRLLTCVEGMDEDTRHVLLAQHSFALDLYLRARHRPTEGAWRAERPPSLYFDSGETPPTFFGLDSRQLGALRARFGRHALFSRACGPRMRQ